MDLVISAAAQHHPAPGIVAQRDPAAAELVVVVRIEAAEEAGQVRFPAAVTGEGLHPAPPRQRQRQQDEELGLVYTSVTRDDMSRTSTDKHDIPEIIDELISNSPEAKITLLLFEDPDRNEEYIVHGKLVTDRGYNALHLINSYNPTGSSNYASFTTRGIPLRQLQKDIHATLRKQLKK